MRRQGLIAVLVLFAGCISGGFIDYGISKYPPKPTTHEIPVLETLPNSGYVIIGTVWAEGKAGYAELDQMLPELRKLARKAGGDALYQLEFSTQMVHSHEDDASKKKVKAMAKVVVYTWGKAKK